jgi:bacillithiol system protein YtxJ
VGSWPQLTSELKLKEALSQSEPILIFKHSYRCSISSVAKRRLVDQVNDYEVPIYEIDVVQNRDISLRVEDLLKVEHESPQVLLVRNNEVLYHDSHLSIRWDLIKGALLAQSE